MIPTPESSSHLHEIWTRAQLLSWQHLGHFYSEETSLEVLEASLKRA